MLRARGWLQRSAPGYCNATSFGEEGDCAAGDMGVLLLTGAGAHSEEAWAAACLKECERCSRCRFVSLSHPARDCSWYATCALDRLHQTGRRDGFRSGLALVATKEVAAGGSSSPPAPPAPSPLPPFRVLPFDRAFRRRAVLTASHVERGVVSIGAATRFRRRLRLRLPITIAALGASNTVRGGCEAWQGGKCTDERYRSGWLLQAFLAFNRSWPHPAHRIVNRAMMATGPYAFVNCLSSHVPLEADVVIVAFADMCDRRAESEAPIILPSMEAIIRALLQRRPEPPAVLLFNTYAHRNWNCGGACRFSESCDGQLNELARYYRISTVSVRDALWHDATAGVEQRYDWSSWTQDSGKHFTRGLGNKIGAELLHGWLLRAAARSAPDAVPNFVSEATGWLTNTSVLFGELRTRHGRSTRQGIGFAGGGGLLSSLCASFDDSFGGSVPEPRVLSARGGWARTTYETGMSGERKLKPGFAATARGATLVVDTLASGAFFQVGFLKTHHSHAAVEVSCVRPCVCAALELRAHTAARQSVTELSTPHPFAVKGAGHEQGGCRLELRLTSDAHRFKFISLQVTSARDAGR